MNDKKKYVYGEPCAGGCGRVGYFTYGKCKECMKVECKYKCGRVFSCKDGIRICPKCRKLKKFPDGEFSIINSIIDN